MAAKTPSVNYSKAMVSNSTPSAFIRFYRKLYCPLGFSKGYNFMLFIIFAGAMLGFSLARISYLNIAGTGKSTFAGGSAPGEWYWFKDGHYRIGITLHLGAILPCALLMIWQFLPVIRHRALIIHRLNGYIIILLVLVSNVGALMIARRAFGGSLDTQAAVGCLVLLTTVAIAMAYYNIKRLQIDQHRAWMLRSMFYLGSIITLRVIMILATLIISAVNNYYLVMPCDEIAFLYGSNARATQLYPQCRYPNLTTDGYIAVKADFNSGMPEKIGASLSMPFGMATWLALLIHLVGVEIYLGLTPAESERLRRVSYEKQLEAGFANPGSSGLTSDRWGDAPKWEPDRE